MNAKNEIHSDTSCNLAFQDVKKAVGTIMRQPAVTVHPTATIDAAARLMRDEAVGMLGVLDDDGALVGVLTDRDIAIRTIAAAEFPGDVVVSESMTTTVIVCYEAQSVEDAAAIMGDNQIRHLPVLDAAGQLVGLFSLDMIAEDVSEHLAGETLGEVVETR